MKLTKSQQEAIDQRGSNLLVSASAGSGKTEVLARRCVALIADPRRPCEVDRLLVVTFTRAAAAELRVRIARMLRQQADQSRDATLREHLRRQEVLVDAADIGTIDAWCGRILRAHSAEAGVDGEFAVLGEQDAWLLRRQTLDELFEWIYTADEASAEAARGWLRRHSRAEDAFLRGLVLKLNQFRENLVEVEHWLTQQRERHTQGEDVLRGDAGRTLAAALADECVFQAGQLAGMLAGAARPRLSGALRPLRDALTGWAERLRQGESDDGAARERALLAVAQEVDDFKLAKPRGLCDSEQALFDEVKKRWLKGRLQERWSCAALANVLDTAPAAARLVDTLLDLEQRYQSKLTAAKRARAACEFGDVLRMALDLLGTPAAGAPRAPTEIARRLRERYEHILVDEYQDTSPVQVEILRLVTRDEPGCSNRFMVGDVKQSIYGFRQARPRLFVDLMRAFAGGTEEGAVCYLSDNFRSHPKLVAGLNQMFALLFEPSFGGTAFGRQERLRAGREEVANPTLEGKPRTELHIFEPQRDEAPAVESEEEAVPLERLEREALAAARMIDDMLAGGVEVPDRDEHGAVALRPLRLSDIVILLRSAKQNAATVAAVLRSAGIPCLTSGRDALFDVPEVMDVRSVLGLLVNRRQDVPLAGYLRSPLVGLSAAELLRVRAAAPRADFWEAAVRFCGWSEQEARSGSAPRPVDPGSEDDGTIAKVRAALAQLERWGVLAREEELPELLRQVFRDTGLRLFAAGLPGGEHRVALLRAIESFAADFARQGQHGVAEFVGYLEDLTAADLDPGLPVAAGENAVRIMTIHAAKGLEFPVVFLLNTGSQFNRRRANEPLQCDENCGIGLKFCDYPARADLVSARHQTIKHRAVARDLEEELRLLYVATTRARERLLICGHAPAGAWDRICSQYAGRPGPLPLASRLSARNMLEWAMMAVAASGMYRAIDGDLPAVSVTTHSVEQIEAWGIGDGKSVGSAPPHEWNPDDEAWLERSQMLLEAPLPTALKDQPAVLSVSAIKELTRQEWEQDSPHVLDAGALSLRVPAFAAGGEPEGRVVGAAVHRFMEHADLKRLGSQAVIQQQVDGLVAAGRLSAAEAALLPAADVAWFAGTPAGRMVAVHADAARREVPFVYALPVGRDRSGRPPRRRNGEATIVRGVIDCLLETDAGLVILDYKTDRVAGEAALKQRVHAYAVQLQLYAQAAAQVFARPVAQGLLIFLHARKVVSVPGEPRGVETVMASLLRHE